MKCTASPNEPAGILRVKRGTNPNSSSVGSEIPAFLFTAVAMTVLGAVALQVNDLVRGAFARRREAPKAETIDDAS